MLGTKTRGPIVRICPFLTTTVHFETDTSEFAIRAEGATVDRARHRVPRFAACVRASLVRRGDADDDGHLDGDESSGEGRHRCVGADGRGGAWRDGHRQFRAAMWPNLARGRRDGDPFEVARRRPCPLNIAGIGQRE